jgi:hypothetical protein
MGRKRPVWDVFQKAGTPEEDTAFAFALPIIGRTDWYGIVATELDSTPVANGVDDHVIFDFVAHRSEAKRENTASLDLKRVMIDAGWLANGLQQHPNPNGTSVALWKLSLPDSTTGRPVLTFSAFLNNKNGNGASFEVKVNGESQWSRKLAPNARERGEIDLSRYAGGEVTGRLRSRCPR